MALDRRHFLASAAALLTTGLAACGGSDSDDAKVRTTVLVYMLGSDLESGSSQATLNLQEALNATGHPQVRLLITTGGAEKVDPKGLVSSWKTVKRFELVDGRLNELQDLGVQNMDESATLQEFLTWGCSTAPAERYMLMMWDHGGGYYGFGSDENFPASPGIMRMPSMVAALNGFQKASGITLDYIGFDACLMATVEVAHVLQPYARFLGASQELEPGSGWDWQANTQALSNQPGIAIPDFGRASAEAFVAKQVRASGEHPIRKIAGLADYVTFSIIDLAKVPALMEQLAIWAQAMLASYSLNATRTALAKSGRTEQLFWPPLLGQRGSPLVKKTASSTELDPSVEHFKRVALQRLRAASFGNEAIGNLESQELDLVDLTHFSALLAAEGIAMAEQKALQEAIGRAVQFNITGPRAANAGGLSIYFPKGKRTAEQVQVYAGLNMPKPHLSLIERHLSQTAVTPSVIEVSPLRVSPAGASFIEANIASVYGVEYADLVLIQPSLGGPARLMGTLPLAGGAAFDTGLALFDTEEWLLLDGQPLLLDTLRYESATPGSSEAYILTAPVRHKRASGEAPELVLLIMRLTKDEEGDISTEILGVQNIDLNNPDAPPDRVDTDLSVGDILEPLHLMYDLERNQPHEVDGQPVVAFGAPITLTKESQLTAGPLPAGQYHLSLLVTDFAGEDKWSQVMEFAKA